MNYYIQDSGAWAVTGTTTYSTENGIISLSSDFTSDKGRVHPNLAFKWMKKKFGVLENLSISRRIAKLEKAINNAIENGQDFLAEKMMKEISREMRESIMYAKGIKYYVERDDLNKYKNRIKDGHISDTLLKNFTRVIPKDVLAKKKKVEDCFDDYVIYHYYSPEIENKLSKKQKMSAEEIAKMKDPILFGIIKETNRLYFIADWEDEYCDLTFDEIVDVIGENKLTKYPELLNNPKG